ncbi:hypothetical protein K502DRAFT_363476 [Neoconidiobolus thromboides FSU 785]|nr:hypothetical protein K502DRAFT_363476 [Neoconidiobolus thromboides FSU 785]
MNPNLSDSKLKGEKRFMLSLQKIVTYPFQLVFHPWLIHFIVYLFSLNLIFFVFTFSYIASMFNGLSSTTKMVYNYNDTRKGWNLRLKLHALLPFLSSGS